MTLIIVATFLCGINIILWLFFFLSYKKKFSPEKLLAEIRNEVNKLLIEISREADADITLIEERRRGLKNLLDEADKRILLSENQLQKRQSEKKLLSQLHEAAEVPRQNNLFDVQVEISDEAFRQSQSRQAEKNQAPSVSASSRQVLPAALPQKLSLKEQINELHSSGLGAAQIAERLKISLTEVQLAIALGGG